MNDDEEDEFVLRPFEQGHWEWSEDAKQLMFMREVKTIDIDVQEVQPQSIRKMEFKYEVDLLEEQRFKKHFQRQLIEEDVVKLQDVKDIVLFCAPKPLITRDIINVLHMRVMDRFLRALIFYCQYYLQVASIMADRILDLQSKIKTTFGKKIEERYEENLRDVRLLLAKEYCSMLLGTGEYLKYHHNKLGTAKSLSKRDSVVFESVLRISTHIAWIALGRKSFQQIELEIQRVFKSNTFNVVKHFLKTDFEKDMTAAEHSVLYGSCEHKEQIMGIHSPLLSEVTCHKNAINYRLFGLGDFKYPHLTSRLLYFKNILVAPELELDQLGLTLGIIGLPRERFDTMLREVKKQSATTSSASLRKTASRMSSSRSSAGKSTKGTFLNLPLYPDIILPESRPDRSEDLADAFPGVPIPIRHRKNEQRLKWLRYAEPYRRKRLQSLKNK
ncbi:PREDICTED: uncharacterized protein LOC106100311 [Papilio polytes]|uniref:uncharacterized protein LOC106100311 n=1 Tax=Papilio polytes TaxID=76194 RepID=UPI000675EF7D|nr:PREDICTED: uncharacterized protein LOC106100311 [Papilio polytes]